MAAAKPIKFNPKLKNVGLSEGMKQSQKKIARLQEQGMDFVAAERQVLEGEGQPQQSPNIAQTTIEQLKNKALLPAAQEQAVIEEQNIEKQFPIELSKKSAFESRAEAGIASLKPITDLFESKIT